MFKSITTRGFTKSTTLFILILGSLIAILDVVENNVIHLKPSDYWDYPLGVYNWWFLFNPEIYLSIIITVFPLLASVPYADSYIEEKKSGFLKNILLRQNKNKYLTTKFFINFLIGGMASITPLVLNLIVYFSLLPAIKPNIYFGNIPVFGFLPDLYVNHPLIYIILRIGNCFIFGGIFASIALTCSLFVENRYIAIGIPFFIYTILDIILDTFNFQSYSPLKFLFLDVPFTYGIYVIATVTIIIFFVVFCVGGKKSENI
ncbi:membrane-spanning protein [Bacillus subtilis]|uniref:membrane-spanning protein n=2 Tax=Bacillus subtilis TaxID=1423 RepID=UPI0010643D94|nr:membrane-spanning protein [Bacillus subtilis]TDU11121.1 hypothetical protein DFO78_10620 [Bacillus subtilis]